ncbi:MAG: hypothetical protein HC852_20520 [Acaryochloridaceae cyanobacterium RU_4_10]|nr:hypothetical protein [Acaryochloridaceae cyanobacterium RU_4_10]
MIDQAFRLCVGFLALSMLINYHHELVNSNGFKRFFSNSIGFFAKFLMFGLSASFVEKGLKYLWSNHETKDYLIAGTIAFVFAWVLKEKVSSIVDAIGWNFYVSSPNIAPINVTNLGVVGLQIKRVFPDLVRTERDLRVTAYHEAGHALIYSLLREQDIDFLKASIKMHSGGPGSTGSVSFCLDKQTINQTEDYLLFRMLVCLAGAEGEAIGLGIRQEGCKDDVQKWLSIANTYLNCGFGDMPAYAFPETEQEILTNHHVQNQLMKEQRKLLRYFFEINIERLNDLAELLLEKEELDKDRLLPILKNVIIPPDIKIRSVASAFC